MRNHELKARCSDLAAAEAAAAGLGGWDAGTLIQRDTYFHVPHGRLKLREITPHGGPATAELIQYHRPDQVEARVSDYVIVPISDAEAMGAALTRALGVRAVVVKARRLYLWRHTRIHLDTVEELGAFIELETVLTDESDAEAQAELARAAAALDIRDEDRVAASYVDLLLVPAGD
jgi:adenylate cyclase class 2